MRFTERLLFLRFPGQWETELWEDASLGTGGLYFNVYRWYENATGRYTRPDPLGLRRDTAQNIFVYAESTPMGLSDPLGLCSCNDECPGGEWSYVGGGYSGAGIVGFQNSGGYYSCDGKPQSRLWVRNRCFILGLIGALGIGGRSAPDLPQQDVVATPGSYWVQMTMSSGQRQSLPGPSESAEVVRS